MQSRRDFLEKYGMAGAGLVLPGALREQVPSSQVRTVSLFHTTDLHGHVLPTKTYGGIGKVGEASGMASPMIFLGKAFWQREKPVFPLLTQLAAGHEYGPLIGITDERSDVVDRINRFAASIEVS